MVIALVLLSIIFFITLDLILRKEEKEDSRENTDQKSPIFLRPEKSLHPVAKINRLFHPSHTWIEKAESDKVYVSFDSFISTLFSTTVKIENLPMQNTFIQQGSKLWDLKINGRLISQLAPVSGRVDAINPACKLGIPLPSKELEKSWIVKLSSGNYKNDSNNLLNESQTEIINSALKEELIMFASEDHMLNDGGEIDPLFLRSLDEEKWNMFVKKFFPYEPGSESA